jgi:dihydroorotate dehydrogenase (NAD+) catalytic subunit
MRIDLRTKRPVLKNVYGGLSGPAVFPIALRMVHQTARAVKIPVIGMGGIQKAEDVIEMMLAGAAAVEVGTANLTDPMAAKKIIEDLPARNGQIRHKDAFRAEGGFLIWERTL